MATRVLQIQAKRFYVDVKENRRGRFIKLAEVAAGRRKNRILLPMSIVAEFRDKLAELQLTNDALGQYNFSFVALTFLFLSILLRWHLLANAKKNKKNARNSIPDKHFA